MTAPDPTATSLVMRLFGPLDVRLNGQPLPRLRSHKGEALLALLTLRHGCEVQRGWLAGMLWPDCSASQGLATLRRYLTDLRHALGPEAARLHSPRTQALLFDLTGATVDVLAFDVALARGDRASLEAAVALYRGPLLEGWEEEWVFQERQPRLEAYLEALEKLAAGAAGRGELGAAEGYLRRAVAVDPLRETTQRALMQALAATGNYAAVLQSYRELRLRLHQELNAEPDPETRALFQQLRGQARGMAAHGASTRCAGTRTVHPPAARVPADTARPDREPSLPAGTVTFLLTDIEGSTRLWEEQPEAMRQALARHDALAAEMIAQHGGTLLKRRGEGDSLFAVFARATDALAAASTLQLALVREPWPTPTPLGVRMALHTGEADQQEEDYFGPVVNRCARLRAAAHGGQVLLTQVTQALVREELPEGAALSELGSHRLRDLQQPETIFQLLHPDLPRDFPPLQTLSTHPNNLPQALSSFVGREKEIAEVKQRLGATRLLTLTGVGGTGKSRLSLQVAADLMEAYPEGVWLVELAPLADPALVGQTLASVLSVREEPGVSLIQNLAQHLKPKRLLLVLDNCEHLLTACAQLAQTLLEQCPQLTILASSREGLGVTGEVVYRVPSLSLPDAAQIAPGRADCVPILIQYEAVRLFIERASAAQPSFTVTNENAPALAQVCVRLDGIPLAIEMAAARAKALSVEQINERIEDRFRLLTGGSRTALPRQQTLRALIDWSYDLLTEAERAVLRRLSVFSGGWTLEAAEAVCAGDGVEDWEVLDLLTQLVEKSLVDYKAAGGPGRYRLLETVRQYGLDRLQESGEMEAVRGRHRSCFLELCEGAEPELEGGPQQVIWIQRLELEHDNLRAALQSALDGDLALAWRMVAALEQFWSWQAYYSEGYQWLEAVRARASDVDTALRARALSGGVPLAMYSSGVPAAWPLAEEGLALARQAGDRRILARALYAAAFVVIEQGEIDRAGCLLEEGLELAREAEDRWVINVILQHLGMVAVARRSYEGATALFAEALAMARSAGDKINIAWILYFLAGLAMLRDDPVEAGRLAEEGCALGREAGQRTSASHATEMLGRARLAAGDAAAAQTLLLQSLETLTEIGDLGCLAHWLEGWAGVAVAQGLPWRGAQLLGASHSITSREQFVLRPIEHALYERTMASIRAALGEEAFGKAWVEGQTMPLEQILPNPLERDIPDS